MSTDRLSGLALMKIHHQMSVDFDAVVQAFTEQHPRRMMLSDPVFEKD